MVPYSLPKKYEHVFYPGLFSRVKSNVNLKSEQLIRLSEAFHPNLKFEYNFKLQRRSKVYPAHSLEFKSDDSLKKCISTLKPERSYK